MRCSFGVLGDNMTLKKDTIKLLRDNGFRAGKNGLVAYLLRKQKITPIYYSKYRNNKISDDTLIYLEGLI